jgi:hypothetical protein
MFGNVPRYIMSATRKTTTMKPVHVILNRLLFAILKSFGLSDFQTTLTAETTITSSVIMMKIAKRSPEADVETLLTKDPETAIRLGDTTYLRISNPYKITNPKLSRA